MSAETEARLNVRVKGPMAAYVERLTGPDGLYENQSEYLRDLIRHDMANAAIAHMTQVMRQSNADVLDGRMFESTGDFAKDLEIFQARERDDWK
jgi:Arc/MetJ-type ribon-helix-helix transcriptional regulator